MDLAGVAFGLPLWDGVVWTGTGVMPPVAVEAMLAAEVAEFPEDWAVLAAAEAVLVAWETCAAGTAAAAVVKAAVVWPVAVETAWVTAAVREGAAEVTAATTVAACAGAAMVTAIATLAD